MAVWRFGWRWPLALGVVVAVAGGWLSLLRADPMERGASGPRAAAPAGAVAGVVAPTAAPPVAPVAAAATDPARAGQAAAPAPVPGPAAAAGPVPAGLSAEQWQQMQVALADHPQREAELRRITAFLQLQGQVQAFAEARERGASREQLAALARPLQAGLPEHLARGEVGAAEALRLQAALLQVTEPDSASAGQALADWRARHLQGRLAPDPREAAFAAAQQAAVARWQAGGAQDPQALEQTLEELRRQHFDTRR